MTSSALDFIVKRDDFHTCKFVPAPGLDEIALEDSRVLLRVEHFAFTSNNITYAAFGEKMSYWDFFPTEDGWGRIPVWGFAQVVKSRCAQVEVGEKFFGYLPMSHYLVVQPNRISEAGFFDGIAHRQSLHPAYNHYIRSSADAAYDAAREDQIMLLRPLFITSFILDDFLEDNGFFDAKRVILSSASSKTAYGLAHQLSLRGRDQCEVIGLTSKSNLAFTKGMGCYHEVVTYDDIDTLATDEKAVYVDMSGNAQVRGRLHHHFGDQLTYSCAVGGTHWDQVKSGERLPGPRPVQFFAPAQIKKRNSEWGTSGFNERFGQAWRAFQEPLDRWMRVVHGNGAAAVERVYRDMVEGKTQPDVGNILSFFE
jgi:hypothetical protein